MAPAPNPLFGTPRAIFNPRQLPGLGKIHVLTGAPRYPRSKIEFSDPVLCRIHSVPKSASWARDLPVLCCLTSYIWKGSSRSSSRIAADSTLRNVSGPAS